MTCGFCGADCLAAFVSHTEEGAPRPQTIGIPTSAHFSGLQPRPLHSRTYGYRILSCHLDSEAVWSALRLFLSGEMSSCTWRGPMHGCCMIDRQQ